jgi:hypothetical protein
MKQTWPNIGRILLLEDSVFGNVHLIISSPISIPILVAMKRIAIKPTLARIIIGDSITNRSVFPIGHR